MFRRLLCANDLSGTQILYPDSRSPTEITLLSTEYRQAQPSTHLRLSAFLSNHQKLLTQNSPQEGETGVKRNDSYRRSEPL